MNEAEQQTLSGGAIVMTSLDPTGLEYRALRAKSQIRTLTRVCSRKDYSQQVGLRPDNFGF